MEREYILQDTPDTYALRRAFSTERHDMNIATPWGHAPFTLIEQDGNSRILYLSGRPRWALEQLMDAGARGCTPMDNPAPRWSGYVHVLRTEGITIETLHEPHGGAFAGTHGRYVLQSVVMRGKLEGAA